MQELLQLKVDVYRVAVAGAEAKYQCVVNLDIKDLNQKLKIIARIIFNGLQEICPLAYGF